MNELNEATTKPYEDYRCFIPPTPKFHEIFLEVLRQWKDEEHFYDLSVGKRWWEVEFKLPPRDGENRPDWAKIRYRLNVEQKLCPDTGRFTYYLMSHLSDVEHPYCRQLMAHRDWKLLITEQTTCLRGVRVGKEMIWSYTEDGLAKINRVARDIEQAGTLKKRLLAGEL
jgi:hypothetical protein